VNAPITYWDYLVQQWRQSSPVQRQRWIVVLIGLTSLWLVGAVYSYYSVAGIARLSSSLRWPFALATGPMGFLWGLLTAGGFIEDSVYRPNRYWPLLSAVPLGIFWLLGSLMGREPDQAAQQRWQQQEHERSQGRLSPGKIVRYHRMVHGIPLAAVRQGKQDVCAGVPYEDSEGHVLVTGPTRSGKGLHLTQTLLQWPGAALVIDPKSEQYERTAEYRRRHFGSPIYRLPGHCLCLADYYDRLLDRDSLFELHGHFLRPWQSKERIFADKSRALFTAVGLYARARHLDPIRVLLDAADCDPVEVLHALESVADAKRHVRLFTDGLAPKSYQDNRFATSAMGTFTTQLNGYQKHLDTIAPPSGSLAIPADWAQANATIYITYSLSDLQGVGGVVAAVVAALMRHQVHHRQQDRVLVAVDELPAVGLYNVTDYLATVGGYGITLVLYAQAVSQLLELYGHNRTQTILANTAYQVWYPPADLQTARLISDLYGTAYRASRSQATTHRQFTSGGRSPQRQEIRDAQGRQSWELRPALEPSEVMGLPKDEVVVLAQGGRQHRFLAGRLNPIPLFPLLPTPAALPLPPARERGYTDWHQCGDAARPPAQMPDATYF
jgi:type IV secretion system protein VirD4